MCLKSPSVTVRSCVTVGRKMTEIWPFEVFELCALRRFDNIGDRSDIKLLHTRRVRSRCVIVWTCRHVMTCDSELFWPFWRCFSMFPYYRSAQNVVFDRFRPFRHVPVTILSEIWRFGNIPYYRSPTKMLVRPRGTLLACYNMLTWRYTTIEWAIMLFYHAKKCDFWPTLDLICAKLSNLISLLFWHVVRMTVLCRTSHFPWASVP